MKLNLKRSKLFHVISLLPALHQTWFQAFYTFSLLHCIKTRQGPHCNNLFVRKALRLGKANLGSQGHGFGQWTSALPLSSVHSLFFLLFAWRATVSAPPRRRCLVELNHLSSLCALGLMRASLTVALATGSG